ncbi:non-ribosomal peptide synthetase [Planctobacterium marinum]|uniref:non-ribosomal peptide synthetase n=1 Tax=Planctobacterium marinum TaxID=1631968 RepID=UPI001E6084F8|nr:non-ribosomal peptide synthetase [Planctobacterium marinum]MCC2607745.1 amino acid adenylation domain-containing protein [Planctobacterium marinum]
MAPRTDTEKLLCEIWSEVLGVDQVGVEDNFFALGGHSLIVVQVVSKLKNQGIDINPAALFTHPTIAELVQLIDLSAPEQHQEYIVPENLISTDGQKLTPEMLTLVDLSEQDIQVIVDSVGGSTTNIQDIYPLGPLQEGILYHHILNPESDPYVIPHVFRLDNQQMANSFIDAMQFVVDRHDTLRSAILWQGLSKPVQVVLNSIKLSVERKCFDSMEQSQHYVSHLAAPENQHVELTLPPLVKVHLITNDSSDFVYVVLQFHHIATDHMGIEVIKRELTSYFAGQQDALPHPVPYRNFIAQVLANYDAEKASTYFTQMLDDFSEITAPFGVLNTKVDVATITELKQTLPIDLSDKINALAQSLQMSSAAVFHLAFGWVVAACCGRNEALFGTVLSGRLQGFEASDTMVGVCINTLPVRVSFDGQSGAALLRTVNQALLSLLNHEQTPLSVVKKCAMTPAESPLFTAILNYRHGEKQDAEATSDEGVLPISGHERTSYPIYMAVDKLGDDYALELQVASDIQANDLMEYMINALQVIAQLVSSDSSKPLVEQCIVPTVQSDRILSSLSSGEECKVNANSVHGWFEEQVEQHPDKIALVYEQQSLTYKTLNLRANQLAHKLKNQFEVGHNDIVAVALERSSELLVSLLAVMKVGASYLPLDPSYPADRITHMIEDARPVLTITDNAHHATFANHRTLLMPLSEDNNALMDENLALPVRPDAVCYVIYTSGSTGLPKGVEVPLSGVVNFLNSMSHTPGISGDDRLLSLTTVSFDISVLELFLPLVNGATVVLASDRQHTDPVQIADLLEQHDISMMQATPSRWQMLMESGWRGNTNLKALSGGEPLTKALADKLLSSVSELWNLYGPTETTIWSGVSKVVDNCQLKTKPVGQPIDNTSFYVLNQYLQLAPQGVIGELYIGGHGVANGYLNRPELTSERFSDDPFSRQANGKMYKTGDLVRINKAGQIEFLGRNDNQVKLRGYRIELGEIEAALERISGVERAVVILNTESFSVPTLVAYVHTSEEPLSAEKMRKRLTRELPNFMVPNHVVNVEHFAYTPAGKINRTQLPELDEALVRTAVQQPETEVQQLLCEIWKDLLGVEQVGIDDNFFALGGDSILAIMLVSRCQSKNLYVPPSIMYDLNTVRELAGRVEYREDGGADNEFEEVSGEMPLLPVHYDRMAVPSFEAVQQFNMSLMFEPPKEFEQKHLLPIVNALYVKHDALRIRFSDEGAGLRASYCALTDELVNSSVETLQLSEVQCNEEFVSLECQRMQAEMDLENGPLFRMVYFSGEHYRRLFILVHHAIMDSYSWRIMVNDLEVAYRQLRASQSVQLPGPSSSYQKWAKQLAELANSGTFNSDLEYWLKVAGSDVKPIAKDYPVPKALVASTRYLSASLSKEETTHLLQSSLASYDVQINELLLTCVYAAIAEWTGDNRVLLQMESHGREALFDDVDLSQTLGWFLASYPYILSCDSLDLAAIMDTIKQQYKEIPSNGISYGVLRYLAGHDEISVFDSNSPSQFVFNYLGQFDQTFTSQSEFKQVDQPMGDTINGELMHRPYLLSLQGSINNGELNFRLDYSDEQFKPETMQHFGELLMKTLRRLIASTTELPADAVQSVE